MSRNLAEKRRELDRVHDHLERLDRDGADAKVVTEYRALARKLADEITDMEAQGDA